jgi:hypothetical protein
MRVFFWARIATVTAFLPFQNPPWPVSYAMNQSTLSMACNSSSGWFDVDLASQIGIVSFDCKFQRERPKTNAPKNPSHPLTLIKQGRTTKVRGPPLSP